METRNKPSLLNSTPSKRATPRTIVHNPSAPNFLMPPEIDSLNPESGTTGETITIDGKFFGTKKGKVTIGGKSCKVTSWRMDPTTGISEVKFFVPKGLNKGTYELKVINKIGEATGSFTID